MSNSDDIVELIRVQGDPEALVIKALLESNNIPVQLNTHIFHSVHAITVDGLGEVRVLVPREKLQKAQDLIRSEGMI